MEFIIKDVLGYILINSFIILIWIMILIMWKWYKEQE
jgi:hypothetical protein